MRYYRVSNKKENLLDTNSVELAEKSHDVSVDEILDIYNVETVEDLEEILEDSLYFDSDGHFGAGLYYNGVCCCESLDDLKKYFALGSEGLRDSIIYVFEGEWVGSCNDGEVVIPSQILERLSITDLD